MTTVVWVVVAITGRGLRHTLYRQQQGQTQQQMKMSRMMMKPTIPATMGNGEGL